ILLAGFAVVFINLSPYTLNCLDEFVPRYDKILPSSRLGLSRGVRRGCAHCHAPLCRDLTSICLDTITPTTQQFSTSQGHTVAVDFRRKSRFSFEQVFTNGLQYGCSSTVQEKVVTGKSAEPEGCHREARPGFECHFAHRRISLSSEYAEWTRQQCARSITQICLICGIVRP